MNAKSRKSPTQALVEAASERATSRLPSRWKPRVPSGAANPRGQSGVALIEAMFGVLLIAMLAAPLVGLTFLTMRSQVGVKDRNHAAQDIGMLRSYLQRDVGEAFDVDTSPTLAENPRCLNPGGANGSGVGGDRVATLLRVMDEATGQIMQIDYNYGPAVDQSGNEIPGKKSVWRRACDDMTRDLIAGPSQLVEDVEPTPTATCVGSFATNPCPTMRMDIMPGADGAIEASVTASRRLVNSSGDGEQLNVGDIPVELVASTTYGPVGTTVDFSAIVTYAGSVNYEWRMPGESVPRTTETTSFDFDTKGRYPVFLHVYDPSDPGTYGTSLVIIVIGNTPPAVVVACGDSTYTEEGAEPCDLMRGSRAVSASLSSDPEDGANVQISWESVDRLNGGYDPEVQVRNNYANGDEIPEGSVDRLVCDPTPPREDVGCQAGAQLYLTGFGQKALKVTATDTDGASSSLLLPMNVTTQPPTLTGLPDTATVPSTGSPLTFTAEPEIPDRSGPDGSWQNDRFGWVDRVWFDVDYADGSTKRFTTDQPEADEDPDDDTVLLPEGELPAAPDPYDFPNDGEFDRTLTTTFDPRIGSKPMQVTVYAASDGGEISTAHVIQINTGTPPVADFTYTTSGSSPWSVEFNSTSTDDVMPIPNLAWDFGPFVSGGSTGSGKNVTKSLSAGNHQVTLVATDALGEWSQKTKTVKLAGNPPKPTGLSQARHGVGWGQTAATYTWDGQPGVDGYEFEYQRKSFNWVPCNSGYGNTETTTVSQPASPASATISHNVGDVSTLCAERIHLRSYVTVNGTTYRSAWTDWIEW